MTDSLSVLRPQIIRIGNRRYRKTPVKFRDVDENPIENFDEDDDETNFTYEAPKQKCLPYEEEADLGRSPRETNQNFDDGDVEERFFVTENQGGGKGRFKASVAIPNAYLGYVIGKGGETRKRIEAETQTALIIPKFGDSGDVVVAGPNKHNVTTACNRILLLVDSARKRQDPTHFLSIPFNSPEILKNFQKFRETILSEFGSQFDAKIFQNPEKLHLTLGMLTLMDQKEREKAQKVLENCWEKVLKPILGEKKENLVMQMRGLEFMNDDPAAVDVLYAKVQLKNESDEGQLQKLADSVVAFFAKQGLLMRQNDRVKLHVTLMNSLFRMGGGSGGGGSQSFNEMEKKNNHERRETFNAKEIMKKFGNFDFGEEKLKTIHISERFAKSQTDGYYLSTGKITF